jgi:hypothetical protein
MLRPQPLDTHQLNEALTVARRKGVRDSRLKRYTPKVIELLYPALHHPHLTYNQRAAAAENIIVAAVESLDAEARHLLSILLCLTPDTSYSTLQQRREKAAEYVGILPRSWEGGWRERQLLDDLTARIDRLHHDNAAAYIPRPNSP